VSSDDGTVAVGVKHDNTNEQTNLFFSDTRGEFFILSLANVRYFARKSGEDYVFTVDIHKVEFASRFTSAIVCYVLFFIGKKLFLDEAFNVLDGFLFLRENAQYRSHFLRFHNQPH